MSGRIKGDVGKSKKMFFLWKTETLDKSNADSSKNKTHSEARLSSLMKIYMRLTL